MVACQHSTSQRMPTLHIYFPGTRRARSILGALTGTHVFWADLQPPQEYLPWYQAWRWFSPDLFMPAWCPHHIIVVGTSDPLDIQT